jgi:hypothetical protein
MNALVAQQCDDPIFGRRAEKNRVCPIACRNVARYAEVAGNSRVPPIHDPKRRLRFVHGCSPPSLTPYRTMNRR